TSSKLSNHEDVPGIAKIVESFKFEREDPNGSKHTEGESNKIPAIPGRRLIQLRREQLSPATPHWTNIWLPNMFSNIVPMRASIPDENGVACDVPERRSREMHLLSYWFPPFLGSLLAQPNRS